MGRPEDAVHASGACCGACEHAADVQSGAYRDEPSAELVVPPSAALVLVAELGDAQLRFELAGSRATIGRAGRNEVPIPDDITLSRVTCEVVIRPTAASRCATSRARAEPGSRAGRSATSR